MNRINTLTLKLFSLLFCLIFLASCENQESSAYINVNPATATLHSKSVTARAEGDETTAYDQLIIRISHTDGRNIARVDTTLLTEAKKITVPVNIPLVVNANASLLGEETYRGEYRVNPLRRGQVARIRLIMYAVSDVTPPIQIDLGIDGETANDQSLGLSFSRDGNALLFSSKATNLINNDDNNATDFFLQNTITNKIENVQSNSQGELALSEIQNLSSEADISADGVYSVFSSDAANLVSNDTNNVRDVFLKNTISQSIHRISEKFIQTENPPEATFQESTKESFSPQISNDARYITFISNESLLSNQPSGLFLYKRLSHSLLHLTDDVLKYQLSGNGKFIILQKSSNNELVIVEMESGESKTLSQSNAEFQFSVNQDATHVVYSEKVENKITLFHFNRNKEQIQTITTSSTENGDYQFTLSDDSRYLVYAFQQSIYLRELINNNQVEIAKGESPFISLDGKKIGFTFEGKVFTTNNLLFTPSTQTVFVKAISPDNVNVVDDQARLKLNWQAVENASYYRIYQSTTADIDPDLFQTDSSIEIIETEDTSIDIDTLQLPTQSEKIYFVVTAINTQGESLTSTEVSTTIQIDTIAPTVVKIVPANNQTNVGLNNVINIEFSETMDINSINNIQLLNGASSPVQFSVNTVDDITFTLTPNNNLLFAETYTVSIPTSIRDAVGNTLSQPFTSSFTTFTPTNQGTFDNPILIQQLSNGTVGTGKSYYVIENLTPNENYFIRIKQSSTNLQYDVANDIIDDTGGSSNPLQCAALPNSEICKVLVNDNGKIYIAVDGSLTTRGGVFTLNYQQYHPYTSDDTQGIDISIETNKTSYVWTTDLIANQNYVLLVRPLLGGDTLTIKQGLNLTNQCLIDTSDDLSNYTCEYTANNNGGMLLAITSNQLVNFNFNLQPIRTIPIVDEQEPLLINNIGFENQYIKITGLTADTTYHVTANYGTGDVRYQLLSNLWQVGGCSRTLSLSNTTWRCDKRIGSDGQSYIIAGGSNSLSEFSVLFEKSIPPNPLANAFVSAGKNHACYIDNSKVTCEGDNTYGQSTNPVFSDATQVSVGDKHSCVIRSGSVSCWGDDSQNQLSLIPNNIQNPIQLSAGGSHTCVLDNNGISCWGANDLGQTDVPNLTNPKLVASGLTHTCALDGNSISCWGNLQIVSQYFPPSLTNVTQLSAGGMHTCALANNQVNCWGDDSYGQISIPSLSNPTSVSAGEFHTCAIDDNGAICWGKTADNQTNVPVLSNPTQISAGSNISCAIDDNGPSCWIKPIQILDNLLLPPQSILPYSFDVSSNVACLVDSQDGTICWGDDNYGLVSQIPQIDEANEVSVGLDHACVADTHFSGPLFGVWEIKCWGDDTFGQVSNVPEITDPFLMASGNGFSCAVDNYIAIECWGNNDFGQLNPPPITNVEFISASDGGHICVVDNELNGSSRVLCWGNNSNGQTNIPSNLNNPFHVSTGDKHTCAADIDGIKCWGDNSSGQSTPPPLTQPGYIGDLSTGTTHSCAVIYEGDNPGIIKCWGDNSAGQLNVPSSIIDPIEVRAGNKYSCATTYEGIICWGLDQG